jgi:hypothetical protein
LAVTHPSYILLYCALSRRRDCPGRRILLCWGDRTNQG